MKITTLTISDYKRIRDITITPDADRSIILIGGKNASGKSSTLDALTAAFGGKRAQASDPVRHGAKEAAIFVELDGGKLTIDRVIKPDGTSTLEVRDPEGAIKAPQAMLEKLVGARMLDPLAFLQLEAKAQRVALMKLIPQAERIDKLNESRERGFSRRTELGRDLKKAEAVVASLPIVEPGKPIDVAALYAEASAFRDQQHAAAKLDSAADAASTVVTVTEANRSAIAQRIERLERDIAAARDDLSREDRELADARAKAETTKRAVTEAVAAWQATTARRAQVDADLARADAHNQRIAAGIAEADRRKRAEAEVEKLKADTAEITKGLETVEARKAEILAGSKLPVPGLSIGDEGITFNGVPFEQASGAEQLRVALGLAIAASPGLHDVWIKDGALLDEEHLELVAQMAGEAGKRVWVERVGTRDPGAIVIQDGQVVA